MTEESKEIHKVNESHRFPSFLELPHFADEERLLESERRRIRIISRVSAIFIVAAAIAIGLFIRHKRKRLT